MTASYKSILHNTSIIPAETLRFPFNDYGLLYGFGVFETILVSNSKPIFLTDHLQRLQRGARRIGLSFDLSIKSISKNIHQLISKNQCQTAALNLYFTAGDRNVLEDRPFSKPQLYGVLRPLSEDYQNKPVRLALKKDIYPRSHLNSIKTMSYTKNFQARQRYTDVDDILFYTAKNGILETTSSNVFFVKGKTLITPNSAYILPGITRKKVIDLAIKEGFRVVCRKIDTQEISTFDEIFLTSSLRGIINVENFQKMSLFRSKSVTQHLQQQYIHFTMPHV